VTVVREVPEADSAVGRWPDWPPQAAVVAASASAMKMRFVMV
jgi:hypothetical protein